jgi:hypothetical protein
MVRTQIQLTENQARALKKMAQVRQTSVAGLIRKAVDGIIRSQAELDKEEVIKRALALTGKFSSGRRDISRNHDRFLSEAYRP